MSFLDDQRILAKSAGTQADTACCKTLNHFVRRGAKTVCAQRQRRGCVVEPKPLLGDVETKSVEPSGREPTRMRQRDRQVVECRLPPIPVAGPSARTGRAQRERQIVSPPRNR